LSKRKFISWSQIK